MQEVSARTGGKVILGPATLYGTINRMLEAGLIKESATVPAIQTEREFRREALIRVLQKAAEAKVQLPLPLLRH